MSELTHGPKDAVEAEQAYVRIKENGNPTRQASALKQWVSLIKTPDEARQAMEVVQDPHKIEVVQRWMEIGTAPSERQEAMQAAIDTDIPGCIQAGAMKWLTLANDENEARVVEETLKGTNYQHMVYIKWPQLQGENR